MCNYFKVDSNQIKQPTNNEKTFKNLLKEFNENIDKLFQKAEYTTMQTLIEVNHRIQYELERL